MIKKPFTVAGQKVDGELLDSINRLKLSKSLIHQRVSIKHWSVQKACTTRKMTNHEIFRKRQEKRHNPASMPTGTIASSVKTYHMPLDEIHRKYGAPGELMHKEEHAHKSTAYHW
jgi:hypothetical protein